MVASNNVPEDAEEEEEEEGSFFPRRKKQLPSYRAARKDTSAMMKRTRLLFSVTAGKITKRARAVGPHKRIINNGLAMGVQLLVSPFAGQKPSIVLNGLGDMPADMKEAVDTAVQQVAALCVAHGRAQQVRPPTLCLAACMLNVGCNQ